METKARIAQLVALHERAERQREQLRREVTEWPQQPTLQRFEDYRDLVAHGRWDWHGGNDL